MILEWVWILHNLCKIFSSYHRAHHWQQFLHIFTLLIFWLLKKHGWKKMRNMGYSPTSVFKSGQWKIYFFSGPRDLLYYLRWTRPPAHQCQKSGSPVYTYIQAFMPYESTEDPSNQPDSFHSPGPLNSPLNLFGPLRSLGLPHKTSNVVADAIRHLRPPPWSPGPTRPAPWPLETQ